MTTEHEQPGLARLAATTPARDWSRGRLTGRLDWRRRIADAALPDTVSEVVLQVVRRSRLWRGERADVAAELVTHFEDGLQSGATAARLVESFGDPRAAARLIRRSRKRNRHWTWHALVRTTQTFGGIMLALLIAYALLAFRFFTAEPTITRNFAAEHNAEIDRIPEQDRAWSLYEQTYGALEPLPEALIDSWPDLAPKHPRYDEAVAYLHRQAPALDAARQATQRPRLGAYLRDTLPAAFIEADERRAPHSPIDRTAPSDNPMMITILLPELGHMRALARLLTFEAHEAARAGDADGAAGAIETMLAVGRHAGDRPILISRLVEIAIFHLASNTLGGILHDHPDLLSDDQLRALAHRLHADGSVDMLDALRGEEWMFRDMVQRVYSDNGDGNGHLTAKGLRTLMNYTSLSGSSQDLIGGASPFGPITAALVADRASLVEKYDELMHEMKARAIAPMWEYETHPPLSLEVETLAANPIDRVRYFPIVILMPALDKAVQAGQHHAQRRDAILAGIALELWRREHGAYPQRLDQLAPAFLPAPPRDRFTGDTLGYAVIDGEATLWSVGANRIDDGGRRVETERDESGTWISEADAARRVRAGDARIDGDWVLWPIQYEPETGNPGEDRDR